MNKKEIMRQAVRLAKERGIINITRSSLCEYVSIPPGSFNHYAGCDWITFLRELTTLVPVRIDTPKTTRRCDATLQHERMLLFAIEEAKVNGYQNVTPKSISRLAGNTRSAVFERLGNHQQVRDLIMHEAVTRGILEIIAQGILLKDPIACTASHTQRIEASALLLRN